MQRIKKDTMLNYLPTKLDIEEGVNPARIFEFNNNPIKEGAVVYLIEREFRFNDNFALNFAIRTAKELGKSLKVIYFNPPRTSSLKNKFLDKQIKQVQKDFANNNLKLELYDESQRDFWNHIPTSVLVLDFNPILNRNIFKNAAFKIYEIDGHNIVPARFVSEKQEYSAATLRRKIYFNIATFLTEIPNGKNTSTQAQKELKRFIKEKLPNYCELKNDPNKNATSKLSKYLNLGFISSQRLALEVLKSDVSSPNKEAFLEELIVRKELADNFCLYGSDFKSFEGVPVWAKDTLNTHKNDFRQYLYSQEEFEHAQTHNKLWNAAQTQLLKEGTIHGYLRMYWAKKILEWSESSEEALNVAIYLNDKYAFDAPSANGYVGILWSMGALHDRAFAQRPVIGKIRPMTFNGAKSKFDVNLYISKFS